MVVWDDLIISSVGIVAAILTMSSFVPQITKGLRTHSMNDISVHLMLLFIAGFSLWIVYGIMRNDPIIIASNLAGVAFNVFLLLLKLKLVGSGR